MNRMITGMALTALLVLPISTLASPDGEMDPGKRMDHMQRELDLTDAQREQIEAIFKDHHEQMKKMREDTESRINDVLTEEQQAEFEGMREERRERFRDKLKEKREERKGKDRYDD